MLLRILPWLIIIPPLAYALISIWCARRYFSRRAAPTVHRPPISILKPVKGMDADSYDNFASFCRQNYPEYQIIFAVAADDDPAIGVIRRIIADFPDLDIQLAIDSRIHGPNFKVCNLMNAYPRARHDIIIICDSDIRVGRNYLEEVAAPFARREVGLVTSLYRSPRVPGMAAAIEAMGFTAEMVPNVMVALQLEGLSFALGASMAVRREALEKIGGLAALVDYLADDYQLGNKIHRAGYKLELSGYFVESEMHSERLATILSRQLRWARTMRVSRPGGYLASGITQAFPMALLALAVGCPSWNGLAAAAALYAVRSITVTTYSRSYIRDGIFPRWLWLLPIRDMFAFATWALSFLGNRVSWRGHRFRLVADGKIVPD